MVHNYIHKNNRRILSVDYALETDKYSLGTTWEDYQDGRWVELTEAQMMFASANARASIAEIYNMALIEVASVDTLGVAKQRKMEKLAEHDESTNVFYINGVALWLDKGTRTSLIANTIPALEANGQMVVVLWSQGDNPQSFELPISAAKQALAALELYALDTYGTTAQHKANVSALSTIEAVEVYDVTAGYPNPLTFEI